ncbi:MAG TPA: HepT-like ribonuclease domain-containing protein [Candidatus Acidoferrales bacterium]|nr:HepT-like ribonuclease domain-containing protein [Candidatus Acidoferrales bacterium]
MAQGFVAGVDYVTFKDDNLRLYAVTRCLEIISEASRRLPDALKARHASIEWRDMAAAGNIYRHEYEDVAARRVWQTLTVSLPLLRAVIEQELKTLDQSNPESRVHAGEGRVMSNEDQITWFALKLEFPDEVGARLEKIAQEAGLSLKCYCVRVLLRHLLKDASAEQKERWQQQWPATLRRNGCDDDVEL